jgi:hypothetical protein
MNVVNIFWSIPSHMIGSLNREDNDLATRKHTNNIFLGLPVYHIKGKPHQNRLRKQSHVCVKSGISSNFRPEADPVMRGRRANGPVIVASWTRWDWEPQSNQ